VSGLPLAGVLTTSSGIVGEDTNNGSEPWQEYLENV